MQPLNCSHNAVDDAGMYCTECSEFAGTTHGYLMVDGRITNVEAPLRNKRYELEWYVFEGDEGIRMVSGAQFHALHPVFQGSLYKAGRNVWGHNKLRTYDAFSCASIVTRTGVLDSRDVPVTRAYFTWMVLIGYAWLVIMTIMLALMYQKCSSK